MTYRKVWRGSGARNLTCIEEAGLLHNIVMKLPAGSLIVEIGSYEGCSSVILASVVDERNQRLLCVDPLVPFGNGGVPVTEETPKLFKRNVLDKYKNVTWAGYGVTSVEAAKTVDEEIDFIFIDAEHTYKAVLEDCTAWLPKLKPGHCVAFHDFYHEIIGPLIRPAIEEYCVGWELLGGVRSVEVCRKPR